MIGGRTGSSLPRRPCDHRLGTAAHIERLEYCGNVIFHGRLRQTEHAGDCLVAFALHEDGQHFDLARRQSMIGRRYARWIAGRLPRSGMLRRRPAVREEFGWNIDAAGKHQLQGAEHDLARGCFRNIAERADIERLGHVTAVIRGRHHHHCDRRIALAQLREQGEPVPVGQRQVEQYQIEVGMLLNQLPGLAAIGSLQNACIAPELREYSA